jgi:hypothetical protein
MSTPTTIYDERLREADRLRSAFAAEHGVRPIKWGSHNLSRMLRLTDERPERVAEIQVILGALGLGQHSARRYYSWIGTGGVFDHGEMWGQDRIPLFLVGYPYGIDADEHTLLAELARFTVLQVRIDDRPSYYGFSPHHVRVGLAEVRRPWDPPQTTAWTRRAARAARKAFAEEFAAPSLT